MKEIPLTKGKVALVDDEDYEELAKYKWHTSEKRSQSYAACHIRKDDGRETTILMHRMIMDAKPGAIIDHINGDGLDNRRANLRPCTLAQNSQNRHGTWAKSGFKGVRFEDVKNISFSDPANREFTRTHPWEAYIHNEKYERRLGNFATKEEAARAYDARASEVYGEFACLNFPKASAPKRIGRKTRRPKRS